MVDLLDGRVERSGLLREALAMLFTGGMDSVSQRVARERLRERFRKARVDAFILRELVGAGYIRQCGFAYLLTHRGRILLGSAAQRQCA